MSQNEEITAQLEELTAQQDQIELQNAELQRNNLTLLEARLLIEKQHDLLQNHTEELENQINLRTEELLVSNSELMDQNKQLEQFAFIVAHNLRSPVARLLGLTNLVRLIDPHGEEVGFILNKVAESGKELDTVIHDLSHILDVRKGAGKHFETVSLTLRLASACITLKEEIEKSNARIMQDFSAADALFTIAPYIESIFYNLISNAIKYRHPDRVPLVVIRTSIVNGFVELKVKDNGLGFDMPQYGEKVFNLYQRFHQHTEGRGIGLYLVKTQAEAVGGHISVHSVPEEGAEFTIVFDSIPQVDLQPQEVKATASR